MYQNDAQLESFTTIVAGVHTSGMWRKKHFTMNRNGWVVRQQDHKCASWYTHVTELCIIGIVLHDDLDA